MVGFIDDSYIAIPSGMGGTTSGVGAAMTAVFGRRHRWRVVNGTIGGTGDVTAPPRAAKFEAGHAQRIAEARPYLVVIVGSRDDAAANPETVRAAAVGLYRLLRAALPAARIDRWFGDEPRT